MSGEINNIENNYVGISVLNISLSWEIRNSMKLSLFHFGFKGFQLESNHYIKSCASCHIKKKTN